MRFSTLLVGAAATLAAAAPGASAYDSTVVLTTLIYSTHTVKAPSSAPVYTTPTLTPEVYKTTDQSVYVSTYYAHHTTTIEVVPKYSTATPVATPVSAVPTTYSTPSETTAVSPPSYTGAASALKGGVSGAMAVAALVAALI